MTLPRRLFRSYRSKLQASLLVLGLLAIGAEYWQASRGAVAVLRQNTYDRLVAIRETKRRIIEDFFLDLNARVLALSIDESSITALEEFGRAWASLPIANPGDPSYNALLAYYRDLHAPTIAHDIDPGKFMDAWFPRD